MTFDLDPAHKAARHKARAFAHESIQPLAEEIDRMATVPVELARDAAALGFASDDTLTMVIAVEEIAAASGGVAMAAAGTKPPGPPLGLAGLRGATALDNTPRTQLMLAAVALGLGRAALESALADLRRAVATPGASGEKPHWVVADAATELEAARLLIYKAALARGAAGANANIAVARLLASGAAAHAVDAALRVAGSTGYQDGALLERLSRDVRAVALLMGTEEQQRATAAEGLLPL